ncbi:MAG: RimK family alpha-L-glutamate ligase [Candidatus Bathyarchaeia archaeon]
MRIGIITRNENSWCSRRIIEAFQARGVSTFSFSLPEVVAGVGSKPEVGVKGVDLRTLDGVLVRPIGPGSLDEIIFRVDLLHRLARLGVPVTNNPSAIERAADKYFTLTLLEDAGIPVPRTIVTENVREALAAFDRLNGEAVFKPIFGSRGLGITKIEDREIAARICRLLNYNHAVLYLQEYIDHGNSDIRSLVIAGEVVASIIRRSASWKTNVSQGAIPIPYNPSSEVKDLAVKAANTIGCEIAGVDLMEGEDGLLVHEINSQPGFQGLQTATGIDVAGKMADYVIQKARR